MTRKIRLLVRGATALVLAAALPSPPAHTQARTTMTTIATDEDFFKALKELSNWGRWGKDDQLGPSNLITPAKRKRAVALVKEGITISLAHDVVQEKSVDGPNYLDRTVVSVNEGGASDRYQYTGTYHGSIHSHLDSVDCHQMVDGKGYNGVTMEEIKAAGGCPRGDINAQKDGIVTRAVLFDATLLPGKATAQGWLEPGTAVHKADLEALEKIEHVKAEPGDVILLYTGRWKRRAALGAWGGAGGASSRPCGVGTTGNAGWHADVALFMHERDVAFIANDHINDVTPTCFSQTVALPIHRLTLVAMGASIFDNLDLERVTETAKRLNRYEFLFMTAPLRIDKGMGSPVNPIAVF